MDGLVERGLVEAASDSMVPWVDDQGEVLEPHSVVEWDVAGRSVAEIRRDYPYVRKVFEFGASSKPFAFS